MRILILNWRALKDPLEGGAERATFEFAKRWASKFNAEVWWLSPRYDRKISSEVIEGVNFKYIGLPLTRSVLNNLIAFPLFYFGVIFTYFQYFRGKIDVVVDQVHGIPYLTPLYVREKKIVYIHEVAGEIWRLMYPLPIVWLGLLCEKVMFSIYRWAGIKFVANSPSTYADLIAKLHLNPANIKTVFYGVTAPKLREVSAKNPKLTLIYLNRLVKMKGIERGLKVFQQVHQDIPEARMQVVGPGEESYIQYLKELCSELGISEAVDFVGFVDGPAKYEMLGKAHVLINPSYLEGWGLVNIEANRMGTPVVAFDVRGCRDSVSEGVSGMLSPDDDLAHMATNIKNLYTNNVMRVTAQEYAQQFDWDIQADEFYQYMLT